PSEETRWDGMIDEVRIWNRSLSVDEISMSINSNLHKIDSNSWIFYVNQTNLTDDSYNYYARGKDVAGNIGFTETRTVRVRTDSDAPTIQLNQPLDNTVTNVDSVNFNFTVTDLVDSTLTCDL